MASMLTPDVIAAAGLPNDPEALAAVNLTLPVLYVFLALGVMIAVGGLTEFADGNKATILRTAEGNKIYSVRLRDLAREEPDLRVRRDGTEARRAAVAWGHIHLAGLGRAGKFPGQGVFAAKVPALASEAAKSKFLAQVARIGANGAVALPQGETPGSSFDLALLSTNGTGFQNFETFTAALNVAIAVRCLGQNLTTEAQGGSYAAANVQDRVRGDLLRFDAETESTTLHTGVLVPWTVANYGDESLAPWPHRETEPPEDEKAEAETKKLKVETLTAAAALSSRVDVEHELEELGYCLLDESEVPEEPPAQPAPEAPPIAAPDTDPAETPEEALSKGRGPTVLLAQSDANAPFIAGQKWIDGLVKEATVQAQPGVDKIVASIVKATKAASSYEDLRTRLIILAAEAPDPEAEGLFERAILLALGQGTYSASVEIDAS